MVQKKGIKLKKKAPKKEERKTVEKYLKEYSDIQCQQGKIEALKHLVNLIGEK